MCDPITATAVTLTIASGGAQAYSQYQEGKATKDYYDAQARARDTQAKITEDRAQRQSTLIQDTAKAEGKTLAEQNAAFAASQKAILAAAGIDVSSVTGTDIISDTARKQKLDEATLRYNANIRSYETTEAGKFEAFALREEGKQLRFAGKQAKAAGRNQAIGTLLSTAASVAMIGAISGSTAGTKGLSVKGVGQAPSNIKPFTPFKP